MALQPYDGDFEPAEPRKAGAGGLKPYDGDFDSIEPAKQNKSLVGDLGTDLKRGVQKLPGIATGLADIPVAALTNKRFVDETADKLGEVTGFQPSQWAEEARDEYSPERQAGSAEIDQAWEDGTAMDVAGAYASNPGNVAGLVAESLPQMLAGGVLGRGALAAGRATGVIGAPTTAAQAATQGAIAGGVGEGAVIAGGTMDQIDDSVDPRRAAAAAAGAGVAGAALGVLGAKAAQRLGVLDAESAIAGGAGQVAGEAPGLARRVAGGALSEGVLEELPQSATETMFQNWAEEKDLTEGLARAAVEGTLAGSAIGAGVNVLPRKRSEEMGLDPNAGPLSAAAVTAVDSEQALLPAPERLALPAPDQTLYADEQGNVSEQGPVRDVDREQRPVPGREQSVRDFGPGMDQQVERGTVPVAGELMPAVQPDAPVRDSAEPRTFDAQPERQGIPDLRESSINVDAEGNAVPGKIPTPRPADYVQGGRGMDQQAPVGKTYSNVLAAKNAIQRAGSADVLEAVQVGPKQFEVRAIAPPAASQEAPGVEPAPVQQPVAEAVSNAPDVAPAAPAAPAATPATKPAPVKPAPPQPVDRKGLPEILRNPKKMVIARMAKAAGIKKGSPGYDAAVGRLESEYERQVDDAQAALPFEQFNALNKESPEGVNRQAWTQLRKERGIEDAPSVEPAAAVNAAAAEAATSPANNLPEPTDAQKEAGNYRKGHVSVQGLNLAIENPKGSVRRGKRPDGSEWSHAMSDHYGYIKRTEGADGDHVDIYLGDNPASDQVFVIDQVDQKGGFDEHKVMLGFDSQADAVAAYKKNFDAGWKVGPVTPMPMAQFKEWLKDGDTKSPLVGASAELASAPAASSAPKAPAAKIEDAGEKLGGARKDELRGVRERLADMDDEAIASSSLSELWPKDEINRIEDTFQAASYQTVREYIPAKPRVTYKLTGWVNKVKAAREIIDNLSEIGADATVAKMRKFSPGLRPIADKVELLMGIDRAQWGRIGRVSMASGSYNVEGKMTPGSWVEVEIDGRTKHFFGKNSIAEALDDVRSTLNLNSAPEKKMKFDVYTDRGTREVFIAKSGDRETRRLATFKTTAEARDYINNSHNSLVAAWDAVKNRDNVTKADMRRDLNEVRTGRDYRNGADITPDQLLETFGFRGVEFGNWVSQGSGNADRQGMLNQAYDAFMDLADVIGVPPKALSLEGRLGIGFGSRGRGRASAHFEPDTIVINLTKTKGAGSLAHEWFHAADNYFAGKRQQRAYGASRESSYITYRPEPMMVNTRYPSQKLTRAKLDIYQANHPNAPLYAEENWTTDPAHPNGVRPQVEKAFAELVETLDRSPMAKRAAVLDSGTSDGYWSRIIERGARSFETYVIAKLADQGYRNDYLANVRSLEEFSRNQDRYPYLTPDEQGPVSEAFDKLFATIETRVEPDGNLAMYSRQSYRQGQAGEGSRAVQLRLQLNRLIGGWQNAPDIKVVQSIKDLPDAQRRQVERDGAFDVEGIFADGQVYLVADNLRDVKHAAFVLQHEVLGHAGLQGAYGKRLTPLLMSIYNSNAELKSQADALVQRFGYQPAVAMEEVLADMAAAGTIQEQAFWPRLLTAMRNALRSIGLQVNWSDGDIQGLLANARRYIRSGTRKGRGRSVYSRNGSSGRMVEMVDEKGRLLAPNGKPSKLNQKQWHQVRSENFKRWFGDWQAANAQERLDAVKPLKLRMPETWKDLTERERLAKVEESLKGMAKLSEPLPHQELGEVVMGMSGAKKSASSAADPAKQAILARLQSAFEHSIYASSTLDQNAPTMTAYHKLLAPIDVDGVPLVAVFTVREDANGRMFYNTVAVDRKEEAPAVSPGDMSNETQRSTPANTRAPGDFVRQPLQRVNPADVSKVLDANGEPLVLYHGTAEQFNVFDQTRAGRSTGHMTAPLGIFLTNDGTLAKAYAEKATDGMPGLANVMPLFVSIKKPYRMSVAESQEVDTFEKAIALRQKLEREGYDGVQLGNTGTWVAFYNNQVKSATNNTGAFDEVDPDIRYRRSGQATLDTIEGLAGRIDTGRTADAFPELSQEARDFLNKVGTQPVVKRASDWVRERTERAATKIRQGIVDRYAALKELDEKLLGKDFIDNAIHNSSWVLARMSSAASGAMNAMLSTGRLRYDAKERVITLQEGDSTGGLAAVLSQLGPAVEVERFMGWIAANRADKLMSEGRENLFTADEIASGKQLNAGRTADGKARAMLYAKAFKEFQQYRDDVLSIAEATGIISAESRAMWRDEFYVPFYRVMNEDATAGGPQASKGLSRQEAYKKLKGGRQNLNDLLENTLMNFHHLLSASLKNQAAAQTMTNAEKMGVARVVPESRRDPKTSTFVLDKGERVFYEIDDPMVFEALTALADPGLNNLAVQTMSAFKRLFTNMTTVTPQFILANTMRDLMQASATSPTSKNLFKNTAQGLAGYRDAKTRAEMQASGGAFSFGHLYGADVNEVKASLNRTVKGAQLITDPSMIPKILRAGWRKWGDVADTAENISRAATYLQNVEDKGRLRAAYEARDIMDFSQHGGWPAVRFLIRVVPFLNARLQGLDKLYRSGIKPALLTAMGQGTASDKAAAARFATVTGALTLASIALYLANADDEEYRKLEDWQKDSYWFFRIGDNAFFLPKPFEVGAIATMAERLTEQLVDDKATGKLFADRLKDMMTQTFSFSPVPQMFQPVLDIYSNTDAFTGRDIESMGMERLSKGLRSRENTTVAGEAVSAVSRALGDDSPIALSPVQADHLIRGYFGTVGGNAAGIIDTIWRGATGKESPDKAWSEYQPIRRFYRDLGAPAPYSRYSTLFYDGLREANRVYADVRELQGLGRQAEAQDVSAENRNILAMRQRLNQQQRRVSEINKKIEIVKRSDEDGAWKRRELDRLTLMRNQITEQLGKQIESVRAE